MAAPDQEAVKVRHFVKCIPTVVAALSMGTTLAASNGGIPQSSGNAASPTSQRIVIPVSVMGSSGDAISHLTQQDFTVLDNQHAQAIVTFRGVTHGALGATAHAVILVDAINDTSVGALKRQVKEIDSYLAQGNGQLGYPVSIAVISEDGFLESNPSRDRTELENQLQKLTAGLTVRDCATDNGTTSDDAAEAPAITEMNNDTLDQMEGLEGKRTGHCRRKHLEDSLGALERVAKEQSALAGRSVIVWVGPGWSLSSIKKHENWFPRVVTITNALRDAQATLDFVATEDYQRAKEFRRVNWTVVDEGAASQNGASVALLSLPVLAEQSGGSVFNKTKDEAADLGSSLAGADRYYMLAFDPSPAPSKGELHRLQIKVDRPGVTVRAPSLYYGEE